jgi:hypothetical protein
MEPIGVLGGFPSPEVALRLKAVAASLPVLREALLRKSAHVEGALQVLIPSAVPADFFGKSPYGGITRQSGTLKPMAA